MIALTNFSSGELQIDGETGVSLKLNREQANRLILFARMHSVDELVRELPRLLPDERLASLMVRSFESISDRTGRWNLKEKIARLKSLSKGFPAPNSAEVIEIVEWL